MLKVNSLIAQQLGQIISSDIDLPSGTIVTITEVQTSPDLRHAKVFLSVLPEEKQRETMSILINNVKLLQQTLNEKITLRVIPKLRFFIDETEQEAMELERLLDEIKE